MVKNNYMKIASGTAISEDRGSKVWEINISPSFTPSRVVVFVTKNQYTPFNEYNHPITDDLVVFDSDNPDLNYVIVTSEHYRYDLKIDSFNEKKIILKQNKEIANYLKIWVTWLAIE